MPKSVAGAAGKTDSHVQQTFLPLLLENSTGLSSLCLVLHVNLSRVLCIPKTWGCARENLSEASLQVYLEREKKLGEESIFSGTGGSRPQGRPLDVTSAIRQRIDPAALNWVKKRPMRTTNENKKT